MKRWVFASIVVLALAPAAYAGLKNTIGVVIDAKNSRASGSLGESRNSPDSVQAIGCQTSAVAGGQLSVLCFAIDATGTQVMCTSTQFSFIVAAATMGTDSSVAFSYDSTGQCKTLLIFNASEFGPKLP